MNLQEMLQNSYVQLVGAIAALVFVAWLVTDCGPTTEVANNTSVAEDISETHKVSTKKASEPFEIIVEGKVPTDDNENVDNNTGEN